MAIKVQRKADSKGMSKDQIVSTFRSALQENSDVYTASEIEQLANIHAKTRTDNFVVSAKEAATRSIKQGDILIHGFKSKYYLEAKDSIRDVAKANNMNLQQGSAITGDHKIVPLEEGTVTIKNARFVPLNNVTHGRRYECKLIHATKPFVLTHQEHGNMTFPAGDYMAFSAIDPKTLNRVID